MSQREAMMPEYVEAGRGKPIVMLPGMEGGTHFWKHQVEEFSSRYHVVACSYPRRRPSRSAAVSDYVRDILAVLDTLGLERVALFSESFGGIVAQELTLTHPERVAALVLCNTMDRPRRAGLGLNGYTLASAVHPFAFAMPRPLAFALLRWVGRHRGFVMDPSAGNERLSEYVLDHGIEAGAGAYLDRIIAGLRARTTERLASIAVPTLVLRGTEDRVVGPDAIVELVGRIPGAELVLIDGGGHCCQVTLPEATNRALASWLERIGY